MTKNEALQALRLLHRAYVKACGDRFAHVPFHARAVPGWTYHSMTDTVTLRGVA